MSLIDLMVKKLWGTAARLANANTWSGKQTMPSLGILDSGGDHTITFDTASDEAADRTLTIPALGGNDTLVTLGTAQAMTGAKTMTVATGAGNGLNWSGGTMAIRNAVDTNGFEISFSSALADPWGDASGRAIQVGPGGMQSGGYGIAGGKIWLDATDHMRMGNDVRLRWCSAANIYSGSYDLVVKRGQANVLQITEGGGGGGWMEFVQIADIGSPSSNCAGIGAEDVAGTAELIGVDEAGNETQLTPHAADGPSWLYDEIPGVETVYRSLNRYTGRVEWRNQTREAKLMQKMVNGESLAGLTRQQKTFHYVETLDDYCQRTGKDKPLRKWEEDQDKKQVDHNTKRQDAIDSQAKENAEHSRKMLDWANADEANRGPKPERKLIDIPDEYQRKPKPDWIPE